MMNRDSENSEAGVIRVLTGLVWCLLALPPLGAPVLFGGSDTHIWSVAPFVMASMLGVALFFLSRLRRDPEQIDEVFRVPPAAVVWTALFLVSGLFLFTSRIPYETQIGYLRIGTFLGAYWAWTNLLRDFRRGRWMLFLLMAVAVGISIYGIVQDVTDGNMVLWEETQYGERANGTYRCPNHLADYLSLLLPFALVLPFLRAAGWPLRLLALGALVPCTWALHLTQSRAGWLGAITAVVATPCFLILRRSWKGFILAALLAPFLMGAGLYGLWQVSPEFRERGGKVVAYATDLYEAWQTSKEAEEHVGDAEGSDEDMRSIAAALVSREHVFRPMLIADTLRMHADHPWAGHGLRTYEWIIPDYRHYWDRGTGSQPKMARFAHSEYFNLIAECGWIGLGIFLFAIVWGYAAFIRLLRRAPPGAPAALIAAALAMLSGTLVHAMFDFNFQMYANPQVMALLAGIAAGPALALRRRSLPKLERRILLAAGIVASLIGLFFALQYGVSGLVRHAGDRAARAREYETAVKHYRTASTISPRSWRAHYALGELYHERRTSTLDRGQKRYWAQFERDALFEAHKDNPPNAEILMDLGRVHVFLGNKQRGFEYMVEAAEIKRVENEHYYKELGMELKKAGRYREALEAFLRAADARPSRSIRRNIKWLRERTGE
ncbi:O-antigen ligase family protein [Kiritimatiella glycovorans]|nr:O-antigen ligase family protein [Kiritimatiella glycovorans]